MLKEIASFSVKHLQVLDSNGNFDEELMPKLTEDQLKQLYELMVLARTFDKKAVNLQRQGRIGTYAMFLGQEASQVGSAYAMHKEDWLFPTYRDSAALITRGMDVKKIFMYWAGDERGQHEMGNNFPISIPVGSQGVHAVGAGMSFKLRREKKAAVVYFGDGATSKGDMHEAFNFAGVFNLPVVFVCQNNQYAISLARKNQTRAETIAQKAIAYGFDGIQVDGNDVLAVYKATKEALEKAYSGKGPSLIECYTYRISDHTTSDYALRYRTKEEVSKWQAKDPLERMKKFLAKKNLWSESYEKKLQEKCQESIANAVKEMEKEPPPSVKDIFKYTFKEINADLKEQLRDISDEK